MKLRVIGASLESGKRTKLEQALMAFCDALPYGEVITPLVLADKFHVNDGTPAQLKFFRTEYGIILPKKGTRGMLVFGSRKTLKQLKKEMSK